MLARAIGESIEAEQAFRWVAVSGKPASRRSRAARAEGDAIVRPKCVVASSAPGALPVLASQQWMTRPQASNHQSGDARVGQPEYVEERLDWWRQHWQRRLPGTALRMAGQFGIVVDWRDSVGAILQPNVVAPSERMAADWASVGDPYGLLCSPGRANGGGAGWIKAITENLLEELAGRSGCDSSHGGRVVEPGLGRERVQQRPRELAGGRRFRNRRRLVRLVHIVRPVPGEFGAEGLGEGQADVRFVHSSSPENCSNPVPMVPELLAWMSAHLSLYGLTMPADLITGAAENSRAKQESGTKDSQLAART